MTTTPFHHNKLYRFLFDDLSVRGELVLLSDAYQAIIANHDYPKSVQVLLGEMLVATSLLAATLKFEGDITVQIQGEGPLQFAVINGNNLQQMRGYASLKDTLTTASSFAELIGKGYLTITISPKEGERYQGIVALEHDSLAGCIEHYFIQSEQLPTRLFIYTHHLTNTPYAAGMLLQTLPGEESTTEALSHLSILASTITAKEFIELPPETLLYRLFNQEIVRLFPAQSVEFKCHCAKSRCVDAIVLIDRDEIDTLFDQEGEIDMRCDYCGKQYIIYRKDVDDAPQQLLASGSKNKTLH